MTSDRRTDRPVSTETRILPTFLVIGAFRSGTTALQYCLMEHPDVFMCPIKETNFFAIEGGADISILEAGFLWPGDAAWLRRKADSAPAMTIDEYTDLFRGADADAAIAVGEISPMYLYSPRACQRIRHHLPDARLIAVLRQPVERAFSAFMQHKRGGIEPADSLSEALAEEARDMRTRNGGERQDLRVGLYYQQLARYYEIFASEQIMIVLYEDLVHNTGAVIRDVFDFLDVDMNFEPTLSVRYNASGIPRSTGLDSILRGRGDGLLPRSVSSIRAGVKRVLPNTAIRRLADMQNRLADMNLVKDSQLSADERRILTDRYFREDIGDTSNLIGRDLSGWLR